MKTSWFFFIVYILIIFLIVLFFTGCGAAKMITLVVADPAVDSTLPKPAEETSMKEPLPEIEFEVSIERSLIPEGLEVFL